MILYAILASGPIWKGYLRELAVRELVYYEPDDEQLPTDPDEVQCSQSMWRNFVRSAPSSHANSLAIIDWKGKEAPRVDEVAVRLRQYEESLSSSLVSAIEKLVKRLERNMSYSPPVRASVSAIRGEAFLCSGEGIQRLYTPGHPVVLPA